MKTPVFHFQEEVLTDAPLALVKSRLEGGLPCLRSWPGLRSPEPSGAGLTLRWQRHVLGAVDEGTIRVESHERGAHLRLDGRLRGWSAFLLVGWLRWRTDRLLDRIVGEL